MQWMRMETINPVCHGVKKTTQIQEPEYRGIEVEWKPGWWVGDVTKSVSVEV